MSTTFLLLPAEILHLIFDCLDYKTVVYSIRPVCTRLHAIVNSYDRYTINGRENSTSCLIRHTRLIRPDTVVSLTLDHCHIRGWFLPTFDMRDFTRLRSLSLFLYSRNDDIDSFLEPITVCPLVSLALCVDGSSNLNQKTKALLSSIATLPRLQKLRLKNFKLIVNDSMPVVKYALQHLTTDTCTYTQCCSILHMYPRLRKLRIEHFANEAMEDAGLSSTNDTLCSALYSLSMENCYLPIPNLQSVLSWTPSLVHLTLTATRSTFDSVFEGHFWEEFITATLPCLKHFNFFFCYVDINSTVGLSLESIIAPFRTSFWLNEKQWLVSCNYTFRIGPETPSQIYLYTASMPTTPSNVYLKCTASPMKSHSLHRTEKEYSGIFFSRRNNRDRGIGTIGAQHIANALASGTKLQVLILQNNQIGILGAQYLADGLKNDTTLSKLDLEGNGIGDAGIIQFADALRHHPALDELYLRNNNISATGTEHLADALRSNTVLRFLNLRHNAIGPSGAKHLADALQNNKRLCTLYLEGNEIGDDGCRSLADALTYNTTLEMLNIRYNNITATGAKYLAEAILKNTRLDTLCIQHNPIGDDGIAHLRYAYKMSPTLRLLEGIGLQFHNWRRYRRRSPKYFQ